ncbi:DUF979 domain-containing protein [Sphingomonas sp. dw_22]|uniref:DUF979 domain-containing protein n=1 Tax=Sphingomonas sp. dw_22 TaxID=2721175 RepID=UPI001BD5A47E|nr:DUF979 domain-containing protein [Sphingomonas sp. dw_22]
MIGVDFFFAVVGLMFAAFATGHVLDRSHPRWWRSAAFWGSFAAATGLGGHIPPLATGILLLVMTLTAALGLRPAGATGTSDAERVESARRHGNWLFVPALLVPAVTVAATLLVPTGTIAGMKLVDPKQVTLVALGIGALLATALAMAMLRPGKAAPVHEGRRLADSIGWAIVLPQALAALGVLFAIAGVGGVVGDIVTHYLPMTAPITAVLAYTIGMALFTILLGNAFAAFPIVTAGIGMPFVVGRFGGDPTIMCAVGMLSGFCGTLLTPMAANYNLVPAAVLELRNRYAVICAQVPTAFLLLAFNTGLMAFWVYRR